MLAKNIGLKFKVKQYNHNFLNDVLAGEIAERYNEKISNITGQYVSPYNGYQMYQTVTAIGKKGIFLHFAVMLLS